MKRIIRDDIHRSLVNIGNELVCIRDNINKLLQEMYGEEDEVKRLNLQADVNLLEDYITVVKVTTDNCKRQIL